MDRPAKVRDKEKQVVSKFCDVLLNVASSQFTLKDWKEVETYVQVMEEKEASLKMEMGM